MRITVMASLGKNKGSLVAIDNVIINMTSNSAGNSTANEPITRIKEKVTWVAYNKDQSSVTRFCDF